MNGGMINGRGNLRAYKPWMGCAESESGLAQHDEAGN
jgi:hypothetical protein